MKNFYFILFSFCVSIMSFAQMGIGTNTPVTGSILELKSADKALVLTRVANTAAVTTPVNGMIVYDISSNCIKGYQNGTWTGCFSNVGSTGTGTSFGAGGIACDANAFVDPISAGTQAARAEARTSIDYNIDEEPIVLDALGKKFYIQSQNFFWDKNIDDVYTSAGLLAQATSTAYKFPVNYSYNSSGHWVEMKIFGQLYPTKTWKQFSTFSSHRYDGAAAHVYPDYWMILLSTDGEIKTVRYSKRGEVWGFVYPGLTGREGVGKSLIASTVNMNPLDFFATTDVKAYSNVNTPTATNWSWFEPYMSGYFSTWTSEYISAILAFNAADNLFYTWGAKDVVGSQTACGAFTNILLRTNPANITASMTPLPATILNNLLTSLSTTVKVPTNDHSTIIISKRTADTRPVLNIITNNNKVVRYNLDNNFYTSLSMPTGVNAVSIQRNDANGFIADAIYVLGDDGKLYKTASIATAVAQTGTITEYADPIFATSTHRKIMQYTNGRFIDENGLLGTFTVNASSISNFAPKQTVPVKRILYAWGSGTAHTNLFVDTNNNFGEYSNSWGSGPLYNKYGYVAGKVANYLYNRQTNWVAPALIESFQFYPSKCSTY